MPNVAVYTRVSTDDQVREGYSLEVQREYLTNYANQQGFEVYKVYSDEGISAGSTDRPALQSLLADAKQKKFDLVIVYKIDRFSRRLKDLLELVDRLESSGVGFKSATEPFDTTTSAGRLMFQQLGSFAEFERSRLAERVFPGMVKSVQSGNWHGSRHSPFGYSYNKEKKLLEVNEREAKIVRLIFKLCLEGRSVQKIVDHLNNSKLKPRSAKYFYVKFLCDILRNRLYTGKVVWNKKHYEKKGRGKKGFIITKNDPSKVIVAQGKHRPLISEEEFEKAQKCIDARRTSFQRSKHGTYPLTGLLYCEKCNHRYFGVSNIASHKTGERGKWYACSGRRGHFVRCNNATVNAEKVENYILAAMEDMLGSDRIKDSRWLPMTRNENEKNTILFNADPSSIKKELLDNREKQLRLTDLYLKNLLSEETFKQKNEALRTQEEELRIEMAGAELLLLEKENSAAYLDKVKVFLDSYDREKTELSVSEKKEILGLIFKKISFRGGEQNEKISPSLYEPFQKLLSDDKIHGISRKEAKNCAPISSKPMDANKIKTMPKYLRE